MTYVYLVLTAVVSVLLKKSLESPLRMYGSMKCKRKSFLYLLNDLADKCIQKRTVFVKVLWSYLHFNLFHRCNNPHERIPCYSYVSMILIRAFGYVHFISHSKEVGARAMPSAINKLLF